jgi:hypothetical protein
VVVPTAAVYEFAEEQGEEEQDEEPSQEREGAEGAAYVRSTVRAKLLYEAVRRNVAAAANRRLTGARTPLRRDRRRQAAIMRRWVSALERRFRSRVRYGEGY